MVRKNLGRIAIIAATALFVILSFFPAPAPFHRVLFSLFFLYLVMLPGWLISKRLVPWARGMLLTASSFVCGTALAFIILFFIALAGGDIRLIRIIIPVIVVLLSLWRPPARGAAEIDAEPARGRLRRVVPILLAALIVTIGVLILKTGDPLTYTSDSPDHIAYIRTVSATHQVFPARFYYPDSGVLTRDIRKGMIHALWGAINALTGSTDAASIWPVISLIGSTFLVISICCAGLVLFGSAATGFVAVVLLVLYYQGGLTGHQLIYNATGYSFGKSFYVLAFAFIPPYLTSPRPGYLALIALSLLAATGTHIAHLAAALFIIAVFSGSSLFASAGAERRALCARRIPLLLAAAILPNVPYLVLRYLRDYAPNNPLHTQVQGALFLTKNLYVMNPLVFAQAAGPLGALALIAVFILWKRSRLDRALQLLLHGVVAVYILLFIPLWYPVLFKKMSYLLLRFEFAVPSMIVSAYLVVELWKKLRNRNPELGRAHAIIGIAFAALFLGVPLAKIPLNFAYREEAMDRLRAGSFRNINDLFEFIQQNCPRGSVIASDPITSFGIPAFTDAYVICPLDQHSTPNDSTAVDRITDCRKLFRPDASMTEIRRILDAYGAGYLVINGRIPAYIGTLYWKPDRDGALGFSERLHAPKSPFRILYERDGIIMAKLAVSPTATEIEREAERFPFIGDSLNAETARVLDPSGVPGIGIKEALPDRTEAARGEIVSVDIVWVATERCPLSSYVAYLRFDTDFPKNALYRHSWGKPYRKIVEKTTGYRYRFRVDFQPLGGIEPPDTWPLLREVHDRVSVVIPRDVSPGIYTISLKMGKKPQYPNFALKDLLTDDDFYGGIAVATLRLR